MRESFSLRNERLPVFRLQRLRADTLGLRAASTWCWTSMGAGVECSTDSAEDVYSTFGNVDRQAWASQ
jgi:magnesium transporter